MQMKRNARTAAQRWALNPAIISCHPHTHARTHAHSLGKAQVHVRCDADDEDQGGLGDTAVPASATALPQDSNAAEPADQPTSQSSAVKRYGASSGLRSGFVLGWRGGRRRGNDGGHTHTGGSNYDASQPATSAPCVVQQQRRRQQQ